MKKVFLFIMLLCCSIVFTGCGNSNSYDGQGVETIEINVNKEALNEAISKALNQNSSRAVDSESEISLKFNDVEINNYKINGEGDYIFKQIMYERVALQMITGEATATSSTIIINIANKELKIIFENINDLPKDMEIYMGEDGTIKMRNGEQSVLVYSVNNVQYISDEKLNKITEVVIEKYNNSNTQAKATFYNEYHQGKEILKDSSLYSELFDWEISALYSNGKTIKSWKKSDNDSSKNLKIEPQGKDGNKYYIISLTELGKDVANGHDLSNTSIRINYIKYDGLDIVNRGLLEDTIYIP